MLNLPFTRSLVFLMGAHGPGTEVSTAVTCKRREVGSVNCEMSCETSYCLTF